jgi:phenylpyruvate tautomerase PptA (4-oxalocrotonate tautomerase family)
MPLVRITYPRGALAPEHKRTIAAALTEIVLDVEVDAVTDAGRTVTVVQFIEAAPDDWAVAGQLRSTAEGAPNHFIVDLIVLEGLLDGARRGDAHQRVTQAFQQALGDADPMLPFRVWVLVHDVREGGWGVGGRPLAALDVAQFLNSDLSVERRAEIAASLERKGAS